MVFLLIFIVFIILIIYYYCYYNNKYLIMFNMKYNSYILIILLFIINAINSLKIPLSLNKINVRNSINNIKTIDNNDLFGIRKDNNNKHYALPSSIAGGLLSGGLHAITGPDHLAALIPPSIGRPGWYGMRLGATWGLGHGISAIFLGLSAFFLKGTVSNRFKFLQKLSTLAESTVGISLIVIGIVGIKENLEKDNENKTQNNENKIKVEDLTTSTTLKSSQAIFANGILHGFSWDGAPSLAPALTMTSWRGALSFLVSYCIGTIIAMSLASGLVSEGSSRLGKAVNNPDLPRNLSLASSLAAIIIGIYWVVQVFL